MEEDYIADGLIDIAVKLLSQGRREQWRVAASPAFAIYDALREKDARFIARYSRALRRLSEAARMRGFVEESTELAELNIAIYQGHPGT